MLNSKVLIKKLYKLILYKIPLCRWGDYVFYILRFVECHKRFPGKKLIFNDVMFKMKSTCEIEDPLRIFVSDKEFLKIFVKSVVGDKYNVPTIAVLKNVADVDNFQFPTDCCIKPTNAAGLYFIRQNGEKIDIDLIKEWFGVNYYSWERERNYRTLRAKVIVEPLVFNNPNIEDYKIFCFNGAPKVVQVDIDRRTDHKRALFDITWNLLPYFLVHPIPDFQIERPDNLSEMLSVARQLSAEFGGFVRVDLYSDGKKIFVGEITNCHGGAGENFVPASAEFKFSKLLFSLE